jgi:fatty-acyl-CoA synthase
MNVKFSRICEGLAESFGDREAFVNVERDRRFTFLEYHLVTNRIANVLRTDLGLSVGDRYVCILKNDNLSLLHWVTAAKAEPTCCHANYRDSLSTHISQLKNVDAKVAFLEQDLLETHYAPLRELGATIVAMDPPENAYEGVLNFWDLVNSASEENTDFELDDRTHVVLVRFTGGTTGDSKCAKYCLDNLFMCRDSYWAVPGSDFNEDTRMIHLAPISHGSGLPVFPTLFQGGCTITINEPDLAHWCRVVERERATHCFLIPTLAYRLLDLPEAQGADLSSLRSVVYSAAPMAPAKIKKLIEKFGSIFFQAYGSTENLAVATSLTKKDHTEAGPVRLASVGRRNAGAEIYVADDDGKPVQTGEIGEIRIRSRAICLGYLNNPEKTEEEFSDGFWKSGDIGYVDDQGYFFIVDRKKDMIISGGFNIYATEVEAALNACPGVQSSAVVGIPHDDWGEAVHAEVVMNDGETFDESSLIAQIKEKIGSIKAPKSIHQVDQLPMSAVGKILRKDVRAKYWSNANRKV